MCSSAFEILLIQAKFEVLKRKGFLLRPHVFYSGCCTRYCKSVQIQYDVFVVVHRCSYSIRDYSERRKILLHRASKFDDEKLYEVCGFLRLPEGAPDKNCKVRREEGR